MSLPALIVLGVLSLWATVFLLMCLNPEGQEPVPARKPARTGKKIKNPRVPGVPFV